jgi:hypothetical protein
MARTPSPIARLAVTAVLALLAATLQVAFAQSHIEERGDHVLRASTVSASNLPDAMREEHSIPTDPNTAVLNVVVQRKADGATRNVPARIEVEARNTLGAPTPVEMREVVANGMVSYLGVYSFLPREVLDFRITAQPKGSDETVTLEFRDRLGRR